VATMSQTPSGQNGQITEQDRIHELLARLAEADETIRAIYSGEVDAVLVNSSTGARVYTLEGADHPYRVMVEQMHEGTVTLDPNHLILYANPQFAALMKMSAEALTGSNFDRFLPPGDSNLFAALAEAAALHGYGSGEVNLADAGGDTVPARVSVTRLEVAEVQTLCVIVSDLREQRRNEAVVKEEQLSRLILDQAGEGIVVIDPQGAVVRCSASARNLSGRPVLLNHFDNAFPLQTPGSPLNTRRILCAASARERIRGREATMLHPDGRHSSLLVSASPLWSESNQLLGCVVTLTDITERKRAEEAQMRQAEELVRSNSDLRQFAYSASHDLREPLRQIAVFSELLQKRYQDTLGDDAGSLIQHTVDAAHRMEQLVKDLLTYTQAADSPQEAVEPTDTNEVVRQTLELYAAEIAQCGARVDCERLPVLDVHEVHVTQLFQNLIGNALKYRGEAPPLISIGAERADGMWKIAVADNGIGIPPDYQVQIFGLFQRLHGGGKSGSGIGLAICQKIVQRYGGRLWVESEAGRGSRFLFTLPGPNY
jgi:PAS domain S-box-containing protein